MNHLEQEYSDHQCWGMVASIDLYDCHPPLLKDPAKIREFIIKLCEEIKMKRFGPALIERFADGALEGYSAMQFIETSSITMHFDEEKNRAFIDIFSCKYFDPPTAEAFCKQFMQAQRSKSLHFLRH